MVEIEVPTGSVYEKLVDEALRMCARTVLQKIAQTGLVGDQHFYLTYQTDYPGVVLSERMRKIYPQEITIVLQNQFWDLTIGEESLSVRVCFNQIPEKVSIPFKAFKALVDPSADFSLKFLTPETAGMTGTTRLSAAKKPQKWPASSSPGPGGEKKGTLLTHERFSSRGDQPGDNLEDKPT